MPDEKRGTRLQQAMLSSEVHSEGTRRQVREAWMERWERQDKRMAAKVKELLSTQKNCR